MSNIALLNALKAEVRKQPQLTLTDYLNLLARHPNSPLRYKEERKKFRTIVNRELDFQEGVLAEVGQQIWWEEHQKFAGKPRQNAPRWAVMAIRDGRIKCPKIEPPLEPDLLESASPKVRELLMYVVNVAHGTKFQTRIEQTGRRIVERYEEADVTEVLELFGAMANNLASTTKVIGALDKNQELYEREIVQIKEKHELEVRLLLSGSAAETVPSSDYRRTRQ